MKVRVDACNCVVPLARVGLNMLLNANHFDTVTWRGCGPHECYPVSLVFDCVCMCVWCEKSIFIITMIATRVRVCLWTNFVVLAGLMR